ncbi:MAG: nucleotidyl transferase AbiEii/AbiGii toxin family protein [Candidatus Izemoplasmatales bacterium]|nr:nucleotidyl transferase AbiEii/AbiGii toxin family protein [Candidatus Izemoplasmatales bacterium]
MILQQSFSESWIRSFQNRPQRANPLIIEKEIYALQLLEYLAKSNIIFLFKGGTCLSLLLQEFTRFSVDIDILTTSSNQEVDQAMLHWDIHAHFHRWEEQVRFQDSKIQKRHFKFYYDSVISKQEEFVLLDIVFDEWSALEVQKVKIDYLILNTSAPYDDVVTPTLSVMLMDKLTAFAPKTIGITYDSEKYTEIIKQMYDVGKIGSHLIPDNHTIPYYGYFAKKQIKWRNLSNTVEDCLMDTILCCVNFLSEGELHREEYLQIERSIRGFHGYVFGDRYSILDFQNSVVDALKVATIVWVEGYQNWIGFQPSLPQIQTHPYFSGRFRSLRGNLMSSGRFDSWIQSVSILIQKKII